MIGKTMNSFINFKPMFEGLICYEATRDLDCLAFQLLEIHSKEI